MVGPRPNGPKRRARRPDALERSERPRTSRRVGYDTVPTAHWVVVDGAIKKIASGNVPKLPDGQPAQGGDLMTLDTFGDFELSWEWKVTPGANSGVKYNVSEELSMAQAPNHAALGFEYQILDDDRHPDGA